MNAILKDFDALNEGVGYKKYYELTINALLLSKMLEELKEIKALLTSKQ